MRQTLSALVLSVLVLAWGSLPAGAQPPAGGSLRVLSVGPQGEIASLDEANEIRVVFSEPMVTLGQIPARVAAPFFRIRPAVPGSFRWSGTTILIFTPEPKRPLPYATTYEVTIDASVAAVSGRRLQRPHTFTFTTPTVKLLQTTWYRRNGRSGAQVVILMRFNQPVEGQDVASHTSAQFVPHDWAPPEAPDEPILRLSGAPTPSLDRFYAKVKATQAAAAAKGPVSLGLATDWDRKAYPPSRDLVVLETTTDVPPEAWVRLTVAPTVPSPAGAAKPTAAQSYTIQAEPAFFVKGFFCRTACPADDRNPLEFLSPVKTEAYAAATTAVDVTTRAQPTPVPKGKGPRPTRVFAMDESSAFSLEDAGFDRQPPARTYGITIDASLQSADGQTLGYTWATAVENWHERAFTSFGDGHGVWERSGGPRLPFYARNFRSVTQWVQRIGPQELMPTILRLQAQPDEDTFEERRQFAQAPPVAGQARRLGGVPDRIQSHGLDLSGVLGAPGTGLVWAALQPGEPIERSRTLGDGRIRASVVQVTNLGISVKDSPQNTLIFVTRLDNGAPVSGARVSIVDRASKAVWTGSTAADGVAIAPRTRGIRDASRWWRLSFIVTAEKDGDLAYAASDWNEGISPWSFGSNFDLDQAEPMLRGTVFSDRGVYRLGEEIHFKAILRHNTPEGIRLLIEGTPVLVSVRDVQNRLVDERVVKVNGWSSAEWTMALPSQGSLGSYSVRAILESDRPGPKPPEDLRPQDEPGPGLDDYVPWEKAVRGSFLVAAYRRPDFRVDVSIGNAAVMAGESVRASVSAKYLFGAPMPGRPAKWTWTRSRGTVPQAVTDALADAERWVFVGGVERPADESTVLSREAATSRAGELTVDLPTKLDAGIPLTYSLEVDVEDVSRQHIANRAGITVHPAPWYVGIRRPSYFVDQKAGFRTAFAAVSPSGKPVGGVPLEITLTQVQWNSVRRAEGNGFYTWDTERKLIPAGTWKVTTAEEPVAFDVPVPTGGYFELEAVARDKSGRVAITRTSFFSLGAGYTAWQRYDHNRIDLVADKPRYKPGDTARIMIQSPWEAATALVTTEREGIRSHRQFALTSTQQSLDIPITEGDIPNLYVSVLLVKGRSASPGDQAAAAVVTRGPRGIEDPSDPGKPAFRLGYVELQVEDATKRLTVSVQANSTEYRPATDAQVRVSVTDQQGRPAQSEVTLWAVDYGVLSLTAYRTPDVLRSVYVHKALQVMNSDSRQRIVSQRVLTPKGETEGGGGGIDGGSMRRDFRVLAFWLGSVTTDADGRATASVKLPESLTTYRIMAVAADRASRFGNGDSEVRVNKPLTMKPAFPRFLAVGDTAQFGAVVTSQLRGGGQATVTIRSLDPSVMEFTGPTTRTVTVAPGGSFEAAFEGSAKAIGRARVQMTVSLGAESDAFEDAIPVDVLVSPETVAAYGQVAAGEQRSTQPLSIPRGIVPGFGSLHVELSSTAMVGLGEGARYLVEYPYGCAEQRGSRALALLLAADLGDAFSLPGLDTSKMRPAVQESLQELERFQCADGGFAYWPGMCSSRSAYLTSYLLHVFKAANDLKYRVSPSMRERAYAFLDRELATTPPVNESWWPAYTAWQAFAVKVMVEGGRNQDSHITRLYGYRDRMPVFALAYLHDALLAKGETAGSRVDDLRRRMTNAVLPEAGAAHVEELSDPYLLWFWNSNVRSTAIVLNTLVRASAGIEEIRPLVTWMMASRKDGRWGNTQENAYALESLVSYYRRYEGVVPDFTAVVLLGPEEIARGAFKGRSTGSATARIPMSRLAAPSAPGTDRPLTFARDGSGTLFYSTRLQYAPDQRVHESLDRGIRVERAYSPYVEAGMRPASTTYKAGDLVRVTLTLHLPKERRFVAVADPLPAGFEPLESWFATTARALGSPEPDAAEEERAWDAWWQRGGFDHVERHDDRVLLFATRLAEGRHEFTYIVRATTPGTFRTAPSRAEEMYQPEVFGRTSTDVITVQR